MGRIPTVYYCPYDGCTASYTRKHRVETHIRSHTGERPFICSHEGCGKDFTCSSHLKRHEDSHGSSYRCTEEGCFRICTTKAGLKKHINKVHLKIEKCKIYTCTQCGKEFKKHNTLQNHELRHSGQFPHKCSVEDCQKSFLTPSKLKRHMKIHEGYPCKVSGCGMVFEKWTLYVQHTKEFHRPEYKCQVCSRVFTRSNALKLHIPLHEETRPVFSCEVPNCSRYYFAKRNLTWHIEKYHAKRPFMCEKDNCHRAFKTEADLADHILYHGRRKPRKRKRKPKPSLAAILSGVAEVKRVNKKPKLVLEEEKVESDVLVASSKLNLNKLDLDTTKLSSIDSQEANQSSLKGEIPCVLTNQRNVNCVPSKAISVQTLIESSQTNTSFSSKINVGSTDELNSVCFTENHIVPTEDKINNTSIESKVPESAIQGYTTIEVVGSKNLSKLISVPVIQIDEKHWNKNISVHMQIVS